MPEAASRNDMLRALKERDFALLWSGQTVSSLGDGIFTIALALEALHIDPHPSGLAFVLAARAVPSVCLALVGGVVVDRVPRRMAMLVSDVVRGVAVASIAVLVATGALHLWALIVMSVVFGAADAFFGPASMAFLPELLPAGLLVQGNALSQTSNQLTQGLLGPAVGGFVVLAIGTAASFGFDAASFAVSAACLVAIRVAAGRLLTLRGAPRSLMPVRGFDMSARNDGCPARCSGQPSPTSSASPPSPSFCRSLFGTCFAADRSPSDWYSRQEAPLASQRHSSLLALERPVDV
jgi:DHA3 family tetracycline resistance protein-like MFS transporter